MKRGKWRNVTPQNHPKFLVKGTELNTLLCGAHYRYQICEVRSYDAQRQADRVYAVRDAATVMDEQFRAGKRSAIVATFATLAEAEKFVEDNP